MVSLIFLQRKLYKYCKTLTLEARTKFYLILKTHLRTLINP